MKVNGIAGIKPRVVELYLPIAGDKDVQFRFRALNDADDFSKVMPEPQPPQRLMKGGELFFNHDDDSYKASYKQYAGMRMDWMILKSMDPTDQLEFETVDMAKPETWQNWKTEFTAAFGQNATNRVYACYSDANSLSEQALTQARERFLASRQPEAEVG